MTGLMRVSRLGAVGIREVKLHRTGATGVSIGYVSQYPDSSMSEVARAII